MQIGLLTVKQSGLVLRRRLKGGAVFRRRQMSVLDLRTHGALDETQEGVNEARSMQQQPRRNYRSILQESLPSDDLAVLINLVQALSLVVGDYFSKGDENDTPNGQVRRSVSKDKLTVLKPEPARQDCERHEARFYRNPPSVPSVPATKKPWPN